MKKKNPLFLRPLMVGGVVLAMLASGISCGLLPKEEEREPIGKFDFLNRQKNEKITSSRSKGDETVPPAEHGESGREIAEMAQKLSQEKNGTPAHKEVVTGVTVRAPAYYEDFIVLDADEPVESVITFNNAPLVDALPAFADILGFDFAADSDLKSTVTVNINGTMTRRELWELFDNMLKVANAGVVRDGRTLSVMPANKMPQQSNRRARNTFDGSSEVIAYALLNTPANEAVNQLRPFLSREGTIAAMSKQNAVLVSDNAENIIKLKQILDLLDQSGRANWPRAVIYCRNVKPSMVAQELTAVLPVIGLPVQLSTDRADTPGAIKLTGVDRLQLIVATAATSEALKEVRDWIGILDNSEAIDQERVYIYKVAHSRAQHLLQAMTMIFTTQGASLTIDTTTGNDRTTQLSSTASRTTQATTNDINTRNSTNNLTNTKVDQVSSVFDTPVRVFADGVNNRLVIRTTPRTYAMVKAMLDRLDIAPAQVLLQILIVEVKLTDSTQFGIEFNTVSAGNHTGVNMGTNYTNLDKGNANAEGFKLGLFNPKNPDEKFGFLRALAGRQKVKVISSPQLMITSNTEASIQIGQKVPLVTGSIINSDSSAGNISNTYDYTDTGIIMKITPQITSTDLIALELTQTVSEAVSNTITSAVETPVIDQREVNTSMTITNGQTMIIGGFIQEKNSDDLKSIPLIAEIPLLKRLFGNTDASVIRTEMLVMITGYIVDEKSQVEDMIRRYDSSVRALSNFEADLDDRNGRPGFRKLSQTLAEEE